MAIPYCDEARAASGRCAQLSSYAESEPRSAGPVQLSIVCSQRRAGREPGNKTTVAVSPHSKLARILPWMHAAYFVPVCKLLGQFVFVVCSVLYVYGCMLMHSLLGV